MDLNQQSVLLTLSSFNSVGLGNTLAEDGVGRKFCFISWEQSHRKPFIYLPFIKLVLLKLVLHGKFLN